VVASDPRVTVVTGGGSGIGRATAIRLARRGDVLCLCDVSATGLKETAALVESERGRVLTGIVDVRNQGQVRAWIAEILERFDKIDCLFSNAGVNARSAVAEMTLAQWSLLIDTHVTWRAKSPWIEKYDGGYKGRFATEYGDDGPNASNGKDLTDKEKDHVRALYDSNVSYQDDLLGQLVEKLETWGVWDQTMLIVTADHGDELWEDGRVGHGGSERETLLHVPLLIHYPPMFPAGRASG